MARLKPVPIVVDASALAAILFGEPEAGAMDLDLDAGALIAPALLTYEFINICVQKHRRTGVSVNVALERLLQFENINIQMLPVSEPEAVALAIRYDLSGYDACYLWLALIRGAPLATLDRKLARAYQQATRELT